MNYGLYDSKIRAFEGELYGFKYNAFKMIELWEQMEEIGARLRNLSSPRIKSKEEAKYQNSLGPTVDNAIDLMMKEEDARREYDYYELSVNRVAKFLQKLDDEELDIVIKRYEQRRTLEDIARECYTSHKVIFYKKKKIFEKY